MRDSNHPSRRDFLKRTTLAGAALAGGLSLARGAHAAGSDEIKIALIGCGGRGAGAASQAISNAAGANVKLVAMADAFPEQLAGCLKSLQTRHADKVDVPKERQFTGLDCHTGAIACDVDMVLLCTPPGFRPMQFEAAVEAGKQIFAEKPVAVDGPGVRRFLAANAKAKEKGLVVAIGHHLRHEKKHIEVVNRIHDGMIGKLMYMRAYFNSGGVWVRPRTADQTEMQHQVMNWYYFNWLCGDHIVEQHVHDLDVCNWFAGAYPIEANGMGGRQVRKGKDYGEIFDHHSVEFTYPDDVKMFSYCRHMPGCWNSFSEHAHGTEGYASIQGHGSSLLQVGQKEPLRWRREADGHQTEHDDLFKAMLAGEPYNEGDNGAMSTLTAIMGRMATYSGNIVTGEQALNSELDLMPKTLTWDADPPVKPGADGLYACAIPGVSKAW